MVRLLLICLALTALLLPACAKKPDAAQARIEQPYTPLEQTDTTAGPAVWESAEDTAGTTAPDWYSEPATTEVTPIASPSDTKDEVLAPAAGQTYVVQKGDTLFELARRFYGDQSKWKDIWEANRARLSDPDRLPVGTKLIIP